MKLYELHLLEALLPPEEKYHSQAEKLAKSLNIDANELLKAAIKADPNPKKKNVGWILKQAGVRNIILPEDIPHLANVLRQFEEQKRVGRISRNDINNYKDIEDLERTLEELGAIESKRQGGLGFDPLKLPGVEVHAKKGPYLTLKITNPESAAELGEGSKWCTRKSYSGGSQASNYIKRHGALFIVFKNNKKYLQYTPNYSQVQHVDGPSAKFKPEGPALEVMKPEPGAGGEVLLGYAKLSGKRSPDMEKELINLIENETDKEKLQHTIIQAIDYLSDCLEPIPELIIPILKRPVYRADWSITNLIDNARWIPQGVPDYILQAIDDTQSSDAVVKLAKRTERRWPQFEQQKWFLNDIHDLISYIDYTGEFVPELTTKIDNAIQEGKAADEIIRWCKVRKKYDKDIEKYIPIILSYNKPELIIQLTAITGPREDLENKILQSRKGEDLIKYSEVVKNVNNKIFQRMMAIGDIRGLFGLIKMAGHSTPEVDNYIFKTGTPRQVLGWARMTGNMDNLKVEDKIAQHADARQAYLKMAGRAPRRIKAGTDQEEVWEPKTPLEAYRHAVGIGNEFPEGENLILQDLDIAIRYAKNIIGPWAELEHVLRERGTPEQKAFYKREVLHDL
jgi:hypothetical protein